MVQRDNFRLAIREMRQACLLVGLGLLAAAFGCGRTPKESKDDAARVTGKTGAETKGKVLEAKKPILQNTLLKKPEDLFSVRELPLAKIPTKAVTSLDELRNKRVNKRLEAKQLVTRDDLMTAELGGLAYPLRPSVPLANGGGLGVPGAQWSQFPDNSTSAARGSLISDLTPSRALPGGISVDENRRARSKPNNPQSTPQVWHRDQGQPTVARVYVGDKNSLDLVSLHVTVTIDGPRARTLVDHVFHNPHDRQLEGTFQYPLPTGASPRPTAGPGRYWHPPAAPGDHRPRRQGQRAGCFARALQKVRMRLTVTCRNQARKEPSRRRSNDGSSRKRTTRTS